MQIGVARDSRRRSHIGALMPELPEVETVMRGLQARLEGRRIVHAAVNRPDLRWPMPPELAVTLLGATVTGFRRRAKYILMRLDSGWSVLVHLGMSGRMNITQSRPNAAIPHEHVVLETDEGWRVGFVDPRRFGSIGLVRTGSEDAHRRQPLHHGRRERAHSRSEEGRPRSGGGALAPAATGTTPPAGRSRIRSDNDTDRDCAGTAGPRTTSLPRPAGGRSADS